MTPEQELAELEELERLEQEKQATARKGADKAIISGAVQGAIGGTIGTPGDITEMLRSTGMYDKAPFILRPPQFPTTQDFSRLLQDATGAPTAYEPQTNDEKTLHSTTAGATSMVAPGGKIKKGLQVAAGAFGGFTGDMVRKATESTGAGAVAQFLATVLPLAVGAKKPQVVKTLQKDLEGLGALEQAKTAQANLPKWARPTDRELVPEALRRAEERASSIEMQTGQRPTLAQTTDRPTALSGVTEEVARSSAGRKLDKILIGESEVGEKLIREAIEKISDLPQGQDTANRILRAGVSAQERPGKVASASAARDYKSAKRDVLPTGFEAEGTYQATRRSGTVDDYFVPPTTASDLVRGLRERVKTMDLDVTRSGKEMRRVSDQVLALAARYPDGIPIGKLDALGKEARAIVSAMESGKAQLSGKDVARLEGHKAVAAMINDAIKPASEALTSGKGKFSRWANTYGEKVQKSPLPDLFPASAARGEYSSMARIITDPRYGKEDITFVAHNLRRADPQAFPALVKQSWDDAWQRAISPKEGRTPQQAMNAWVAEVGGASTTRKRENYLETIRQIQLAHGRSPQEAEAVVAGANAVMDTLLVFSRDRGGLSQVSGGELARTAGTNVTSNMARSVNPIMPFFALARMNERRVQLKVYEEIADALTSPDGAQKLIHISQFSQPQLAAEAFLRSLVSASAGAENSTRQ